MSGLFGFCSDPHASETTPVLERMAARLRHAPHYTIDRATPLHGVGIGRVGIGIFNRARQPYQWGDGEVRLWFCGEDYHQSARRRDLERAGLIESDADAGALAMQLYLAEGADGLAQLDGMFIAAIWDGRTRELVLVNDRYGLYPHYIAHVRGAFVFAPEIKAVLSAEQVPRSLDRTAVAQYVRFQQVLGDRTWLEDVKLLPAATILRYRPGDDTLQLRRYWDWDRIGTARPLSDREAIEETARLLDRSLAARTGGSHRLGLYLSGGLDSRAILACLPRAASIATLTYGAAGSRDVVYAARLARLAGTRHQWFPFADGRWVLEHAEQHLALTEGFHSFINAHGMSTLAWARESVDVMLTGWRRGYRHVLRWLSPVKEPPESLSEFDLTRGLFHMFCRTTSWPGLEESEAAALFSGGGDAGLRNLAFDSFREEVSRTQHYPPDRRADYFYTEQHERRSSINLVTFTRSAVEVRCPLFDYDLLDFLYSLTGWPRQFHFLRAGVVTMRAPRLALVPNERDARLPHSNPLIAAPHAMLVRAKTRVNRHVAPVFTDLPSLYADYEHYLRTDLRGWAEGILFDPRTESRRLFDPPAVRALWTRHLSGRELWTIGKVAPLITLELVLRHLLEEGITDEGG